MHYQFRMTNKQRFTIILCLWVAAIGSMLLTMQVSVIFLHLALIFLSLPFLMLFDYSAARVFLAIFIVSLVFVQVIYVANIMHYGNPYFIGGSDDQHFELIAALVQHAEIVSPYDLLHSNLVDRNYGAPSFVIYIALLKRLFEPFGGFTTHLNITPQFEPAIRLV